IGAILGDASPTDAQHLYDFGVNVGLAFQLQDDLLDVFGDPEQFGKQPGGDILSNKKTYLLLKALEMGAEREVAILNTWMSRNDQPDTKIKEITALYDTLGIQQATESAKQLFATKAYHALDKVNCETERKTSLKSLAHHLLDRSK